MAYCCFLQLFYARAEVDTIVDRNSSPISQQSILIAVGLILILFVVGQTEL